MNTCSWISQNSKQNMYGRIFTGFQEFWRSPEGPVSQIHSPHLQAGAPGIFSELLRSVQMLKREWGMESNGKLPHLSIPSKTAVWVPEFAVKDLPLSRTATLVPLMIYIYVYIYICISCNSTKMVVENFISTYQ